MIFDTFCSFPCSVYSLKTSRRSRSFDCSLREVVKEYASTRRSLALSIAPLAVRFLELWLFRGVLFEEWWLSIRGELGPCFLIWLG